MICCFSDVKRELLNIVLDPNLKVIGLYIDNAVSISYFRAINCIKSVGFLLFVPLKAVSIDYLQGYKIPLYFTVDKYIALVGSELYPNFQILVVIFLNCCC